jgi:group II intron reverse transcriptase/maturase
MTAGVDGTTLDGMSERRIEKIIATLKDHKYKPNPARRTYIEKKGNTAKKRPLGIMSANDRLVQEIVRMILESIYEQNFSNQSHGFRPKRSCHTALLHIQDTFTGVHWFVEGDITSCFDSFNHHVLIGLLRQRIDDEPFIALMWKFLKAGYMEQWEHSKTYDGVPQGSGISPVLSNIYLGELDKFMENYKGNFDCGKLRRQNPEYHRLISNASKWRIKLKKHGEAMDEATQTGIVSKIKNFQAEARKLPSQMPLDENYKRIQYVRYCDDFIIGIIGSKEDAEKVKADISIFLNEKLKLKLSDEKTKITHSSDKARFLGYDITVSRDQNLKKGKNGVVQRSHKYIVVLLVPREKWVTKLIEYKAFKIRYTPDGRERFHALHRGNLINQPDIAILTTYNAEIRGLRNYYRIANNAYAVGRFASVMQHSMLRTFASKYRSTVSKIKAQYIKNGLFTVEYHTKSGSKSATFYNSGFKRITEPIRDINVSILPAYKKYDKVNSFVNRIRAGICELCGKRTKDIAFHQVKKLKDLKGEQEWERVMKEKRRKTLVVCMECHEAIHN